MYGLPFVVLEEWAFGRPYYIASGESVLLESKIFLQASVLPDECLLRVDAFLVCLSPGFFPCSVRLQFFPICCVPDPSLSAGSKISMGWRCGVIIFLLAFFVDHSFRSKSFLQALSSSQRADQKGDSLSAVDNLASGRSQDRDGASSSSADEDDQQEPQHTTVDGGDVSPTLFPLSKADIRLVIVTVCQRPPTSDEENPTGYCHLTMPALERYSRRHGYDMLIVWLPFRGITKADAFGLRPNALRQVLRARRGVKQRYSRPARLELDAEELGMELPPNARTTDRPNRFREDPNVLDKTVATGPHSFADKTEAADASIFAPLLKREPRWTHVFYLDADSIYMQPSKSMRFLVEQLAPFSTKSFLFAGDAFVVFNSGHLLLANTPFGHRYIEDWALYYDASFVGQFSWENPAKLSKKWTALHGPQCGSAAHWYDNSALLAVIDKEFLEEGSEKAERAERKEREGGGGGGWKAQAGDVAARKLEGRFFRPKVNIEGAEVQQGKLRPYLRHCENWALQGAQNDTETAHRIREAAEKNLFWAQHFVLVPQTILNSYNATKARNKEEFLYHAAGFNSASKKFTLLKELVAVADESGERKGEEYDPPL